MVNIFTRTFKLGEKYSKKRRVHNGLGTQASATHTLSPVDRPSSQRLAVSYDPSMPFHSEAWESLDHASNYAPTPNLSLSSNSLQSKAKKPQKPLIASVRPVISLDGIQKDCLDVEQQCYSAPASLDPVSFEEIFNLPVCRVEAWKPMPTYNGVTLAVIASEGEIIDPFRRDPPIQRELFTTRPFSDSSSDSSLLLTTYSNESLCSS